MAIIFSELFSFLEFLKESIKLIPKNGKLIALISISFMLLNSTIFLLYNYFFQSFITNEPLIFAVDIVMGLIFSIISVFFNIATILVSAASYNQTKLSIKELFSMLRKTWRSPLITTFYVSGLVSNYFFFVWASTIPPLLMLYPNRAAIALAILIWIAAYFLFLYLFVTWMLAVVVSVVEESCYGIKALTRSSTLVKGNRFHGLLLNCGFSVVTLIIFLGLMMILTGQKELEMLNNLTFILYGLFLVNISSLLMILFLVAYTVLYFHCKKYHREEIELYGSVHQYTILPTTVPLVNDHVDMP